MIVDTISNAKQYGGIHPGIDRVLEKMSGYTPENFTPGRVVLDGMNLYMNLEEFETHSRDSSKAEAHKNYIDVMYIVEGAETIYVKSVDKLQKVCREYDSDRDILQADLDEDAIAVRMEASSFIVLFPQDSHGPGCHGLASGCAEVSGKIKKIVGKVRIHPVKG